MSLFVDQPQIQIYIYLQEYLSMYRGSTNSDNAVYGIYHHDRYLVASLDNGRVADLPPTGA